MCLLGKTEPAYLRASSRDAISVRVRKGPISPMLRETGKLQAHSDVEKEPAGVSNLDIVLFPVNRRLKRVERSGGKVTKEKERVASKNGNGLKALETSGPGKGGSAMERPSNWNGGGRQGGAAGRRSEAATAAAAPEHQSSSRSRPGKAKNGVKWRGSCRGMGLDTADSRRGYWRGAGR